ncbi:MAG: hypothetical protein WCK17_17290, partial [Verrucomicrobiota bacterium]
RRRNIQRSSEDYPTLVGGISNAHRRIIQRSSEEYPTLIGGLSNARRRIIQRSSEEHPTPARSPPSASKGVAL